jgi:hypothetical protein
VPEGERNVDALVVPRVGRVDEVRDGLVPYRLVDASGAEIPAVSEFLRDPVASDCSPATVRSYAYGLLGWLRFLQAVDVCWDRATRAEARDYALWPGRTDFPELLIGYLAVAETVGRPGVGEQDPLVGTSGSGMDATTGSEAVDPHLSSCRIVVVARLRDPGLASAAHVGE